MPEPGSGYALVKFLTAAACSKYFDATENGIDVPGEKKAVVFVEKQPGPNSINDVIRNCIDGDASRCVRAFDAEEDWSDMLLLKLAKGKGQMKREVDRIKRGKNPRGVSAIIVSLNSANMVCSGTTSNSASRASTMPSTSSGLSWMTWTGSTAPLGMPPTLARLPVVCTSRMRTRVQMTPVSSLRRRYVPTYGVTGTYPASWERR